MTPHRTVRTRQRGISLVLTLIMLVVAALTAAASMRGAITGEKAVTNIRMENLAQEYAEMALRYCEDQLMLESSARVPTLQDEQLPGAVPRDALIGELPATWVADPPIVTSVAITELASADSTLAPSRPPQCFVDRMTLPGGTVYVVTARGFSPGYAARADGTTSAGAVVWLQSTIY
jgi:Tfp pilus assembly protein PilX